MVTPDNHQGNPRIKIAGIIGIISLLCVFANIFYTSSQVKKYLYHLNEQSLRSLSQSNAPYSLDQSLRYEKHIMDHSLDLAGP